MPTTRALLACLAALAASFPSAARQQPAAELQDPGRIERVVLHPSGASVTRVVERDLAQGAWTVRVSGLPRDVDPSRLQARVERAGPPAAGGPRLLGVEYEERPGIDFAGSPEGIELAEKLRTAQLGLERLAQDRAQLGGADARVAQVAARIVANATAEGGTTRADPARTIEQLAWAATERAALLAEARALEDRQDALKREVEALKAAIAGRGDADRTQRDALVRLAVPEPGPVRLEVTYLVPDAAWAPAYAVRADADRGGATIEYDATIAQRTGEEWKDVRLTLSTADPTMDSRPDEVEPIYVDALRPASRDRGGGTFGAVGAAAPARAVRRETGKPGEPGSSGAPADEEDAAADALEGLAGAAEVSESGIAASFELPRRVTIPSDRSRTQRQRIATVRPEARFAYLAQPLATEQVFLRGEMRNASPYQLLPGPAQVFMGGDFIGRTDVPATAPGSRFEVFFGPDRAVRATREVVSRVAGAAGLFGGSEAVTWKYRVRIDNGTGRDIRVELVDRRPSSRNEKVEVKLADLSRPLSTDPEYAAGPQKSGILRWDLDVPAAARGEAALAVTWGVQVTHAKDVEITPLPD